MSDLSAIIITKNEEKNIKRCLESLKRLECEVVVVDSGSMDDTINICHKYGANIYKREFDNFSSQRNFAISKAKRKWILSLDADEEIPAVLANEIKSAIKDSKYDGFLIPRKNIIFGKEIKHTRWAPDKHVWLFRKAKGKFGNEVHEEVQVDGSIGELKNAKIHHSHENIHDFIKKFNQYTELETSSEKYSTPRVLVDMLYEAKTSFLGRFIFKFGFLDGWRGFVLSYLRAIYKLALWTKQWERSQEN